AHFILELAKQQDSFLVLFTAHELLRAVYYRIHSKLFNQGRELLAQGITGTPEKILKKFQQEETAILLGSNTFWEGIDLPGRKLELIVVTRLPFEVPTDPFVHAKSAYLEEQGKSAFYHGALPKMGLRLKQALGRLIRSEEDRG